jgi:hypothetical protein
MKLSEHFEKARKAQLQEYFLRWFPDDDMISDQEKLRERLSWAMCDAQRIRERFDRLNKSSQDFLAALLTCSLYRGTLESIRQTPRAQSIESYEVENLVRTLIDEGWIVASTVANNGHRAEVYELLKEIGDGLRVTVDIESRDTLVMLSIENFIAADGGERLSDEEFGKLVDPSAIEDRILNLESPELREIVRMALNRHGGVIPFSTWRKMSNADTNGKSSPLSGWRHQLESNFLGTTGVLSLKTFGIDLEEDCLVVFQELVEAHCFHEAVAPKLENEREISLGVDLLIDIRRLLEITRTEAVEVTREGTVFKKTEERLASCLLAKGFEDIFEGSPVNHLIQLCRRLRLVDHDDSHLRSDRVRRKIWIKKSITSMLKTVFELYQSDFKANRSSFHQGLIRKMFLQRLVECPVGEWVAARPLLSCVVAEYLRGVEDNRVADQLKELQLEEFRQGTATVRMDRLHQDLAYWVIHRLAVVGLVDLGFSDGHLHSVRVSSLGCRYFKLESADPNSGQVVVNPDFEILLFPGGKGEAETHYMVGSFAERTGTEWVKRYQITPDSVRRGVVSGLSCDDILAFLETKCKTEVPPNIQYSIREWSEGVEPILKQRTLLLKARSQTGADQLQKILEDHNVPHERLGDRAIGIRGTKNEKAVVGLQDVLRSCGLFLE